MGFSAKRKASPMAKTQDDVVAERTEAKPDLLEEEVNYPGLPQVHLMGEGDLVDFFTMVLKSRIFIREVDLTLGKAYNCTEKQITLPKSSILHTLEFAEAARVFVMALAAGGDNCLGFRAVIVPDQEGNVTSKLYLKTADKPVVGPTYDNDGAMDTMGDEEFKPVLKLVSKPY